MTKREPKLQWAMDCTVWHSPDFGHRIAVTTQRQGEAPRQVTTWSWKGLGVPEQVLDEIGARLGAIVQEHLIWRYGVQDELGLKWAGEPEPF